MMEQTKDAQKDLNSEVMTEGIKLCCHKKFVFLGMEKELFELKEFI